MKKFKFLALLLIGVSTFNSCIVDDEDEKVASYAEGPAVIGFNKSSVSFSYFENVGAVQQDVYVELVGGSKGFTTSDTPLSFEIDPSSTATEGTEFSLPQGKVVTLPANRDLTKFPISINTGSLNPTQPTFVKFNIIGGDGYIPSQAKGSLTITFVGCVSTIQEGTYSYVRVGGTSAVPSTGTSVFTKTSVNNYEFNYPSSTIGGQPIKVQLSDVCGDIMLSSNQLNQIEYEFVYDSASFDPALNKIVINNMRIRTNTGTFVGLRGNVTYTLQ